MSQSNDSFGRPSNLEDPVDLIAAYRVSSHYSYPLRKMRADRVVNFDESMILISILLNKYQSTYVTNKSDKSLLLMPNLFHEPQPGERIKNQTTGEIYTVKETIVNPITKKWEGLVRLVCITPPETLKSEKLELLDSTHRVRFTEESPNMVGNEGQTSAGIMIDKGPMQPTIVYSLVRKEPGSIGKTPFGPQKDYRKRLRESVKFDSNPAHTVEIYAQSFDNLVQFDCCTLDNFTANRLVNWFEKFMNLYQWVLKKNGVQQIIYWQRLKDATVSKWRQDLVVRTVQFYFRTEEIDEVVRRDLTKIDYNIDLSEGISDDTERYIADQKIAGPISDQEYNALFRDSNGNYLFGDLTINDGNLS